MKHTLTDDLRDKRAREKAMVERKSEKIASLKEDKKNKDQEQIRANIVREMSLDNSFNEHPSSLARNWQIAQGHLLRQHQLTEKEMAELASMDPVSKELAEKTYSEVMGKLGERQTQVDTQLGTSLLDDLLQEKSHELQHFEKAAAN